MKLNLLIYEHCKDLLSIIKNIQNDFYNMTSTEKEDLIKDLGTASRFYSYVIIHTKWQDVCKNNDIHILHYLLTACYDALLRDDLYLVGRIKTKKQLKKLSYYKELSENESERKKNIRR